MRLTRLPTTSRRHGHWPTAERLRSSTSTITTSPPGGCVRAARSSASYDGVLEPLEERGTVKRQQGDDDGGHDAADENDAARPNAHLTVISTRRLRGSSTSIGGLHEEVGFAMRRDIDHSRTDPRLDELRANRVGAPEAELDVAGGAPRRIGVPDHCNIGERAGSERFEHLRKQRPALVGQVIRFESEIQDEVLRRRRKRRQEIAE